MQQKSLTYGKKNKYPRHKRLQITTLVKQKGEF